MEGPEMSRMERDKEQMCKSPRDPDLRGEREKKGFLFVACHVTHGGIQPVIQSSALSAANVQ